MPVQEWLNGRAPSSLLPSPSYFELYILDAFGVKEEKIGAREASKASDYFNNCQRYVLFLEKGFFSKICFEWLNIAMCTIYHSLPPFPLHQKLICLQVISHHIFRLLSLKISTSESAKYMLKNQRNTYQRIREMQLKESEKYIYEKI